ncbi:MAG: hypothetical protein N3F07_04260 [Candidatus Micrarchaeota archaeon]|nr:hypothetical protein [Candidatus Micrarchaeota archaeon]
MEQLTIITDDKVGLLADISYILGKAKINIESLMVVSMSGKAILTFFVKDALRATRLLKANGYKVLESEILIVKLKDEPGQLSKMSSLLVSENINILNLYFVAKDKGYSLLALRVDKPKKARKVLEPYLALDEEA